MAMVIGRWRVAMLKRRVFCRTSELPILTAEAAARRLRIGGTQSSGSGGQEGKAGIVLSTMNVRFLTLSTKGATVPTEIPALDHAASALSAPPREARP